MKKKDVHVVFGRSGRGTLVESKVLNLEEIQLICLNEILNIGPLCDLYSEEAIKKRNEWFLTVFGDLPYFDHYLSPVEEDVQAIRTLIENPDGVGDIYLWTGFMASEMLSTARLLKYLSKQGKRIFIINFPNIPVTSFQGHTIYPVTLYVTAVSQVKELMSHFRLMQPDELMKWIELWEQMISGSSLLKILGEDGTIYEKEITHYDPVLESYCTDEFQSAARIIGRTLCDIDFNVGDGFLNWRLIQLVRMKKIEARGTLREIREYEVKKITFW